MKLRYWGCDPVRDGEWVARLVEQGRSANVDVTVDYVDVITSVNNAVLSNVIVTPTLDRLDPLPFRRIIAIGMDASAVLHHLEV